MSEKPTFNFEQMIFDYLDQVKYLLSPELWANELLDYSKNELFILFELYRYNERNMSQVAEYLNVPLNTATGIVARMEKKQLLSRVRSKEDKRVVTLSMTDQGKEQIQSVMKQVMHYGSLIFEEFSADEIQSMFQLFDKAISVFSHESKKQKELSQEKKTIRKITIT